MNKIRVENYRAIKDSGEIELRPITIAVGRNSAGKSSFVRLFPLLKQTLEKRTAEPILWYGDYVDFGDYKHTITKGEENQSIKLSFDIDAEPSAYSRYMREKSQEKFLVKVKISIKEKYIDCIEIYFEDQKIRMEIDDKKEAIIIINDERIWKDKRIIALSDMGDLIPNLYEQSGRQDEHLCRRIQIDELVKKCYKYFYNGEKKYDSRLYIYYGNTEFGIGSKTEILGQLKRISKAKFADKKITHKLFLRYNNYIVAIKLPEIIDRINQTIKSDMNQTSYIKPIRAMVNRYYRVQGVSINELDADGSNLPMILNNMPDNQKKEFEKWSKEKFGIVFSVTTSQGHISLIVKNDIDSDIETNVADTGYGYSQMLPIVMLLWMINKGRIKYRGRYSDRINRTVVIEQPELHLHPAYQAKMIDVFVNIIKEAKNNGIDLRIIFETHSETMINRLGLLIAYNKIGKDDVNILVFDKKNNITSIESKGYDENGILSGWPVDFFAPEDIE